MSATARPLGLKELPLLALAGRGRYANHAVTLQHGETSVRHRPSPGRLLRSSLQPGGRQIWLSRDGLSLLGLAAVRRRSGGSAWETDALILTRHFLSRHAEAFVLDLLERCIATAGAHGAHRLFLRLPAGSPLRAAARSQGFAAVCEESLLGAPTPNPADAPATAARWRQRDRGADHDLFRLFCAVVPQEVRWQTALTPAEWRHAQDPLGRGGREWVLRDDSGHAAALARVARGSGVLRATLLAADHAEAAQAATALLAALALEQGHGQRIQLLLPDYAPVLANTLRAAGFQDAAQYELLVRPIAQRTQRLQLAERSVEGTVRPVIQ